MGLGYCNAMAGGLTPNGTATNDANVPFRLRQPRAFASALLLLVQVSGFGHIALARHMLTDSGSIADVAGLSSEKHESRRGHLCSTDDTALRAEGGEECSVLAARAALSLFMPRVAVACVVQQPAGGVSNSSFVEAQLEVLSRAPKASPPQG